MADGLTAACRCSRDPLVHRRDLHLEARCVAASHPPHRGSLPIVGVDAIVAHGAVSSTPRRRGAGGDGRPSSGASARRRSYGGCVRRPDHGRIRGTRSTHTPRRTGLVRARPGVAGPSGGVAVPMRSPAASPRRGSTRRRNASGAMRSTTLPAIGVPSSRLQPSPRTWSTTSVDTRVPPPDTTSTNASARCCATDGQLLTVSGTDATAVSVDATLRDITTYPAPVTRPSAQDGGIHCGRHDRGLRRREPERPRHHPVALDPPPQTPSPMLTRLGLGRRLTTQQPRRQRMVETTRRNPLRQLAQLGLVRHIRNPRQRPHLAERQSTVPERPIDHRKRLQRVADPQPLPRRTHLHIQHTRNPVRTRAHTIERPFPRIVQRRDQPDQLTQPRRPPPPRRHHRRTQRPARTRSNPTPRHADDRPHSHRHRHAPNDSRERPHHPGGAHPLLRRSAIAAG